VVSELCSVVLVGVGELLVGGCRGGLVCAPVLGYLVEVLHESLW
jgi:hypothetical protein